MRHPLNDLSPEGVGAMHAGIIEHHNDKGVGIFLSHKPIKRLDDNFRGDRFGRRVVGQLPRSAEKSQYVQPSAMRVGGYLAWLADRAPGVGDRRRL